MNTVNFPTTLAGWAIALILICGIVGIVIVVIRTTGMQVPGWVIQIAWIVGVVFVGVLAIRLLMGM